MTADRLGGLVRHLRRAARLQPADEPGDRELLEQFLARRDEAAFEGLMRRHGPMVLGVCRRVLHNAQDTEDAFQTTFLVLVRKADSVEPRELVGNWLYGVAYRTALQARANAARRRGKERQAGKAAHQAAAEGEHLQEMIPLLDRELSRLPDKYRTAVVLCDLEGRSRKEAAGRVGIPEGTLSSRLATARRILARRLARHSLTLTAAAIASVLSAQDSSAGVPAPLAVSTSRAASLLVAGNAVIDAGVSAEVAALTEGVLKAMFLNRLRNHLGLALLVLALGLTSLATWAAPGGETPAGPRAPTGPPQPTRSGVRGTWQLVSYEVAGLQLAPEALREKEPRLTFDAGGGVTVRAADSAGLNLTVRGTYKVDPSKSPMTIDLTVTPPGQKKQIRLRGIYTVSGDRMSVVCALPGSEERPASFDATSGVVRLTARRTAPAREPGLAAEEGGEKGDRLERLLDRELEGRRTDGQVVDDLYLAVLSRRPTAAEQKFSATVVSTLGDRREAFGRLLWLLTNTEEFLTDLDARARRAPRRSQE
jgi:RNA polymerase sigma factor (sigma-70 family)